MRTLVSVIVMLSLLLAYGSKAIARTLALAIVATLTMLVVCEAEVIELKTGQRVEGALKSVTSTEVVFDVAGQTLTFPREKVAAIYFGAPPKTSGGSPLSDALKALKGLQSATTAGVSYRDYAPRVTDVKIQVDQLLGDAPDDPVKSALVEALGFHVYASNAWNARIASSNYDAVASDPLYDKCEPLKREVERLDPGTSAASERLLRRGITISLAGVPLIWNCASERVNEAERLLRGQ